MICISVYLHNAHYMNQNISHTVPKGPETTIYVFNMSEDVWPFISNMSDRKARAYEIAENANLCERDLFSYAGEDNVLFISTKSISEDFLSYYVSLFGNKNFKILVPEKHTGVICEDILRDRVLFNEIIQTANSSKKLTITSYSSSLQFLHLIQILKSRSISVYTPEAPEEEDAWTVNFFGSKSGIRQLAQQSGAIEPDCKMANGLICVGIEDAARIAAKKYCKEQGVVIKTNKGHSGLGVLLFRPGDLPVEYRACEEKILAYLRKEAYWEKFPIIIEDYIAVNSTVGGGYPNAEFKVLKTGRVEFLYYCGMRITRDGVFKGVEIHNDVISDRVAAQVMDTGFFVGEKYAASGYRGYYDVDFVVAKNGDLFVTESNVRRTGGTHVYKTALCLFGKDFMFETYILSNNVYALPDGSTWTFRFLLNTFSPILYNKRTREGLIIASENLLSQGKFAYIIFGKNKKQALEIEAKMEELLRTAAIS